MSRRIIPILLCAVLAASALLPTGCSGMRYWSYVFLGDSGTKKVKAEFDKLENKRVAVVVYLDQSVYYEHPRVDLQIAYALRGQLTKNIDGLRVVDPRTVIAYQESDLDWAALPKAELARKFNADYVLMVNVPEFSTSEPGTVRLFRGNVVASPALYQAGVPEEKSCVWYEDAIRVTWPKETQGKYGQSDAGVKKVTVALLADRIAKFFYDHEENVEQE
ncbi:MAG: hypothetical protein ACLFVH_13140 [Phycisphaerae bacterium]